MPKNNIDDLPPTQAKGKREDYPTSTDTAAMYSPEDTFGTLQPSPEGETGVAIPSDEPVKGPAMKPANVIFCGRVESKGELVDGIPPKFIKAGSEKITLPPADEQLRGFYHPKAARIVRELPRFYKSFQPLGGNKGAE